MTKTELIKQVADSTGLSQRDVHSILEALAGPKGAVATTLKKGSKVIISGFGTFHTRKRKARRARNPKTGGAVKVPKRRYPAFKPAKTFKEALKK
jgi:DNA-binding protein HU-beta